MWHNTRGMAYGTGSNGRNGRSNGASRRSSPRDARSDAWRDELRALQKRAKTRAKRQRQQPRGGARAAVITATVLGLGMLSLALLAFMGAMHMASSAYAAINRDLPSTTQLASRETFKTAQLFDRKGRLLWEFFDPDAGRRTVVPLTEISQYLIDATLAAEDANFYSNPGIEPRGIARAVYQNLVEQEIVSGASTITQQLVKNVLIPEDERYQQTPSRKIREALLAYQITQKISKSQILALYLNEIFYGNQAYGVEAASQAYFGKRARELTLAEASMLAGLPQSPAVYNPLVNPVAAKARQAYVLEQMVRHGFITEAEANEAQQAELRYQPQRAAVPGAALGRLHPHADRGEVRRAGALPGRPEDLHLAGLRPPAQDGGGREVERADPGPARRREHLDRGDEPEDRRDPGDGRQHGLLQRRHRRPGERRALRAAAGLDDQAARLPDGVHQGLGAVHDHHGREDLAQATSWAGSGSPRTSTRSSTATCRPGSRSGTR